MRRSRLPSMIVLCVLVGATTKSVTSVAATDSSASRDCIAACSNYSGSPYCLPTGYDRDLSPKLAALKGKLVQTGQPIAAHWLLATFNVPSDPCNRGDSRFSEGAWRNSGLACNLAAKVQLQPGESISLRLTVPAALSAYSEQKAGFTQLRMRGEAVLLAFNDSQWQKDWGGTVEYVAFNDRLAMFQVPRGCISIDLRAS